MRADAKGRLSLTSLPASVVIGSMKFPHPLMVVSSLLAFAPAFAVAEQKFEMAIPNVHAQLRVYTSLQQGRLLQGKFAELEKEGASPTLVDPVGLALGPDGGFFQSFLFSDWSKTPDWKAYFEGFEKWEAAFPKSPISHLAKASALIDYAWVARGGGFSNTVSQDGWKLFGQRLVEASDQLKVARDLGGAEYPMYWRNFSIVCRGLQAPVEIVRQATREGLKKFPQTPKLYSNYCVAVLPRWSGSPGEWQRWLKAQVTDERWKGGEMSDELYAQILWTIYEYIRDSDGPFFAGGDVSWEKMQRGLGKLCEQYPSSYFWRTARVRVARSAGDRNAARAGVEALGGKFDSWACNPQEFMAIVRWCTGG